MSIRDDLNYGLAAFGVQIPERFSIDAWSEKLGGKPARNTLTVVGLFVLRRRRAGEGGFSMRGYPLLPAFYMLCLLGAAARVFTLEPRLALAGIVILATGWPLYRLGHRLFGGAPAP